MPRRRTETRELLDCRDHNKRGVLAKIGVLKTCSHVPGPQTTLGLRS